MTHIIRTPKDCDCDCAQRNGSCPTCDWGLAQCKVCGLAEAQLEEFPNCPGSREAAQLLTDLPIRKVTAASYFRHGDSMGTLVDEGHMTKSYAPSPNHPEADDISWTLSPDAPFRVDNGVDPIINPGETVTWTR